MSRTKQVRVSRVADWAGWCSPCGSEDRPLVLTRTGPTGLPAWLAGLGDDDRFLLLTCNVCGDWQVVPPREEDDPEIVLVDDEVLEAVAAVVAEARVEPAPVQLAPMAPSGVVLEVAAAAAAALPSPTAEQDAEQDAELTPVDALLVEVPPVPAPRAERIVTERIVTVPDTTTLPAFSPEAVAAARRVLEAARREEQRTTERAPAARTAALDRSRRARSTTAGPRTPVTLPAPRPAVPAVATSIVLPAVTTSQLVLAAAS